MRCELRRSFCTFQEDTGTVPGSDGASFDFGLMEAIGVDFATEASFACQYRDCGIAFQHKRSLDRHQRKKHGALFGVARQVTFCCGVENCQRVFYSRSTFATHQKTVHGIIPDELQ